MSDALPSPVPIKKDNYGWLVFFIFLVVASALAAGIMIGFNRMIQLTPEMLETAMQRWKQKGPRNYRMVYTKQLNEEQRVTKFVVTVRAGKVEEVLMNGKPLEPDPETHHDPRIYHSMNQLFNDIDRFMNIDARPNQPKVFVTADFDEQTGALRRYVRRVMGTTQRIELRVIEVKELS
jgi:hypothetical protein